MIGNAEGHENVPTHHTSIVETRAEIDYHCQLNKIKNELIYVHGEELDDALFQLVRETRDERVGDSTIP